MYLVSKKPVEELGQTLILDEFAKRQPDRPTLYNRCLTGNATIDLEVGLTTPRTTFNENKIWAKHSNTSITNYFINNSYTGGYGVSSCSAERLIGEGYNGLDALRVTTDPNYNNTSNQVQLRYFYNLDAGWYTHRFYIKKGGAFWRCEHLGAIQYDSDGVVQQGFQTKLWDNDNPTLQGGVSATRLTAYHKIIDKGDWWELQYSFESTGGTIFLDFEPVSGATHELTAEEMAGRSFIMSGNQIQRGCISTDNIIVTSGSFVSENYTSDWKEYLVTQAILELNQDVYYKGLARKENNIDIDTWVFEEGVGTTIYSDLGNKATITTAEIDLVRAKQDDAPLLPNSGDIVGFGWLGSFNIDDTSPTYQNYNAATKLQQIRRAYNGIRYDFRHYATALNTFVNDPNGNSQGFQVDGSYILYCDWTTATYQDNVIRILDDIVADTLLIKFDLYEGTIDKMTFIDRSIRDRFFAEINTNHALGMSTNNYINTVEEFYYAISGTDVTHGDNYPANALSMTGVTSTNLRTYLTTAGISNITEFINLFVSSNVYINAAARTDWYEMIARYYEETFSGYNTVGYYEIIRNISDVLAIRSRIGASNTGYFALYDRDFEKYEEFYLLSNDTNSIWIQLYDKSPFIKSDILVPKSSTSNNSVLDVSLAYQGRKDFPLTPKDEPAYKGNGVDEIIDLDTQVVHSAGNSYKIRALIIDYETVGGGYATIMGANGSDDFRLVLYGDDKLHIRLGGGSYTETTTLSFSTLSENGFIYEFYFNHQVLNSPTDAYVRLYDLNGNVLWDWQIGNIAASNLDQPLALGSTLCGSRNSSNIIVHELKATVPWIQHYTNNILTHYWEYLGNNSLVIWDRVGGNHGTITTNNITANQGTQDVYSSRLKDGYSESLYFRDGGQVAAANNTIQDETTGDFTLLTWVRVIRNSSESGIGDDQVLIGKGSYGGGDQNGYLLYLQNGMPRASIIYNGTITTTTGISASDLDNNFIGEWVLVAATYDRDGNLTCKIITPDSVIHTNSTDISSNDGNSITNTNTFKLGSGFIYADRELDGSIYQAAKFSSLLTESELIALHTAGLKHSFASNIGDYTSSSNLTGHWISPLGINDTWEDTQGTDDLTPTGLEKIVIPANLLNNGLDIFGNTLTNPSGTYLHSDIKLTSPIFRTLDTALQSNEELYRDTTDSQGNTVYDRLLIPLSLAHSDKGFASFRNDTDYVTLSTSINTSENGDYKVEALVGNIGTYCNTLIGHSDFSYEIGFFGNTSQKLRFRTGSAIRDVEHGIDVINMTSFFIVGFEWTKNGSDFTDIYMYINDLNGNELFRSTAQTIIGQTFISLNQLFKRNANDYFKGDSAWIRFYKNDTLTHLWTYAGNNSLIIQDLVGGNHGKLVTNDVTQNQATQNNYNAKVEGYSDYEELIIGLDSDSYTPRVSPAQEDKMESMFHRYLVSPNQIAEENGVTIIKEDLVPRQADRPYLWKRCLLGDGTSTIDLSSGISGTLTLKGWVKSGGEWSYGDITTGLSGTTLTIQSSTHYKSIERYDDGLLVDTFVCEEGAGLTLYSDIGNEATITTTEIDLVRVEQEDAPLLPNSGDIVGCNVYDEAVLPIGVTEGSYTNLVTYTGRKDFPLTPKDEPAFDTNNGDYAMFTPIDVRSGYGNVGGQTNRFEALIIDYNSSRMIMGNSLSANRAFGFQFGDVIAWHNGSSIYQVDCGLGLASRTEPFIAVWEWKVEEVSLSPQVTNVYLAIQDLQGNILFESNGLPSNNTANAFQYLDTIGNKGGTLGDPIDATIAYIKYYKNDVLTNYWEYLGNNSLVIWDRVGGNHATITTSDITLNQGTQDVYSSRLKDGYSQTPTLKDSNVWSSNGILLGNRGHDLNGEVWYFDQNNAGSGFANWNVTYENNYLNLAPDHVTTAIETFYLFLQGFAQSKYFIVGVRYKVTVTIYMPPSNNWDRAYFDIDADWSDYYRATTYFFPNSNEQTMEIEFVPGNSNIPQNDVQIRVRCQSGYDPNVDLPMEIRNWKLEIMNEDIPANLLNNSLDIFGTTLTHPSGAYAHSSIKLTSPVYRTLDTALVSNEETYRDTTDANGNAVKDRLLIPVSYNHSDKVFPALKFNGISQDYATFTLVRDNISTYTYEAVLCDFIIDGTLRCLLGVSLSDNIHFISTQLSGSNYYVGSNNGFLVIPSADYNLNAYDVINIKVSINPSTQITYVTISELNGKVIVEGQPTWNTVYDEEYPSLNSNFTIGGTLQSTTLNRRYNGSVAYIKIYKNNSLIRYFAYTGNNSFLVQDVVGNNHGTITTANIAANQGEQDVFNPFVDGFNDEGWTDDLRFETHGSTVILGSPDVSIITKNDEFDFTITAPDSSGEIGEELRINQAIDFSMFTGGQYPNVYDEIDIEIDCTVTQLGTREFWFNLDMNDVQVEPTVLGDYTMRASPSDYMLKVDSSFTSGVDLKLTSVNRQLKQVSNNFIDINYEMFDGLEMDSNFEFRIVITAVRIKYGGRVTYNLKALPQHPYNGLDIFDNTLTTKGYLQTEIDAGNLPTELTKYLSTSTDLFYQAIVRSANGDGSRYTGTNKSAEGIITVDDELPTEYTETGWGYEHKIDLTIERQSGCADLWLQVELAGVPMTVHLDTQPIELEQATEGSMTDTRFKINSNFDTPRKITLSSFLSTEDVSTRDLVYYFARVDEIPIKDTDIVDIDARSTSLATSVYGEFIGIDDGGLDILGQEPSHLKSKERIKAEKYTNND